MARLTEEQIAALRPQITEYPERRLIVPGYPQPRKKRGVKADLQAGIPEDGGGALPSEGLSGAPSVRIWSVNLWSNLAGQQIQRSSPRFAGPALLYSFTGILRTNETGPTLNPVQVTYSDAPVADSDAIGAFTKLPGTTIAVAADPFIGGGANNASEDGFVNDHTGAPTLIPLGIYIPLPGFYLNIAIFTGVAIATRIQGTFRIIENAPPESVTWV